MNLRKQLAKMLDRLSQRLIQNHQHRDEVTPESLFAPLTPVLDLEHFENYASAFEAIEHNDVACVAVTGPYGSGKSSILRAYQETKKSYLNFMQISLATFEEEASSEDSQTNSDAIEKSILQQLIYSVARDELPYSRFKKIRPPAHPKTQAIAFTLLAGFTISAALFWTEIREALLIESSWLIKSFLGVGTLVWLAGLYTLILTIYHASVGLSLKRLSLKNGEIETSSETKDSVFNRHLDEILYFFQETDCDIVLIEDLDRFEDNTEIFTKIREVNLLVNSNATIKQRRKTPIKFIFAVRDDLFKGKTRTKFFDLIIPVIPYTSSSNAYSLLCKNLEAVELLEGLDKPMLRRLAVYINDHRLLLNTLNEYRLYEKNLRGGELVPTTLLATVVFKNFFPKDFGELHESKGVFASLLGHYQLSRENLRTELEEELSELLGLEDDYSRSALKSRNTLAHAYWGATERLSDFSYLQVIRKDRTKEATANSSADDILSLFLESSTLTLEGGHPNHYHIRSSNITVATICDEVHPGFSLQEVLDQIDSQQGDLLEAGERRKAEIVAELSELSFKTLNQVIPDTLLEEAANKTEHPDLFIYLIRNDLLGNDYADYMTYFHEGAMSLADRVFCQQFDRSMGPPTPMRIDNPAEVLETLSDRVFKKAKGFHVKILDHIFCDDERTKRYSDQIENGLTTLGRELFGQISLYFSDGRYPGSLMDLISHCWPNYFSEVSRSKGHSIPHSQMVLQWASNDKTEFLSEQDAWLSLVQEKAARIFTPLVAESSLGILKDLKLCFREISFPLLPRDKKTRGLLISEIIEHDLWQINRANFQLILQHYGVAKEQILEQPITSLLRIDEPYAETYISENIETFIERCFLQMEGSVDEGTVGLEHLLQVKDIEPGTASAIIERQRLSLPFQATLPEYWDDLIQFDKFVITWENLDYLAEQLSASDTLHEILAKPGVARKLASIACPIGASLRKAVFTCDSLSDENYFAIVCPILGALEELPESISSPKKRHLIEQGFVVLSDEAIAWADDDSRLLASLVLMDRARFFDELEEFESIISTAVISLLLASDLTTQEKAILCSHLDSEEVTSHLAARIEEVVRSSEPPFSFLNDDLVRAIIALPVSVDFCALLMTARLEEWDHREIIDILDSAPPPLHKISKYGKRPKVPNTKDIRVLVGRLKQAGHISTFEDLENGCIRVNTKRSAPD